MSDKTAIEWTDHTFNPWWGCTRVSAGCANCYAERMAKRFKVKWGPSAVRRTASEKQWDAPRRWNAAAARAGRRARVFCASMADVFDSAAPEESQSRLFDLIRVTPWLDWQLLTKRPENIRAALPADWGQGYRNVWLGTSVENQQAADERIKKLLAVPARVRFLSCEPLIGPVDLSLYLADLPEDEDGAPYPGPIHWVIAGGETGSRARPMSVGWARFLRDQCQAAGVAYFFKQWGSQPGPGIDNPERGTRLLDGREWNEFPQPGPLAHTPKESL